MKRFTRKVKIAGPDDCWEWQATKTESGHGHFWFEDRLQYAHRVALKLTGVNVPDDARVCHTCDNPGCVNPAHLVVADQSWNMNDAAKKGRLTYAKLSPDDVREIRKLCQEGKMYQWEIAKEFGVIPQTISMIVTGQNWTSVQ